MIFKSKIITVLIFLFLVASCTPNKIETYKQSSTLSSRVVSHNVPDESFFLNNYVGLPSAQQNNKTPNTVATNNLINKKNIRNNSVNLIDFSKSDILNLLGTPALFKTNKTIEIWQYRGNNCVLNLVWNNIQSNTVSSIKSYNLLLENVDYRECLFNIIN